MDPSHFSDDIWIEIFRLLPRHQLVANVQRTCRRFRGLIVNHLLYRVLWVTPAQIVKDLSLWRPVTVNAKKNKVSLLRSLYIIIEPLLRRVLWVSPAPIVKDLLLLKTVDENRVSLPRSLRITHHLELHNLTGIWPVPIPIYQKPHLGNLYHWIHAQVPRFTSLDTITISNITFSLDTYHAFQLIPTLRSLRILNCEYHDLELSFEEERLGINPPAIQLSALPITDLCLHNVRFREDPFFFHHLVRLLICPSLTSLAITWDSNMDQGYQLHVHDPLSRNHPLRQLRGYHHMLRHIATRTRPRASRNLTDIEVRIPLLEHKFGDGLVSLISPSPAALVPPFRVKIHVIKVAFPISNFAEVRARQSRSNNNISSVSNSHVWSYTGPVCALDAFVPSKCNLLDFALPPHAEDAWDGLSTPLTQLRFRPAGEYVSRVIWGLERLMRPLELEHLEVSIHSWDVEILFAIKEVCPNVVRLVVRYGEGTLDEDRLIALGSPIFSHLKRLHTIRLVLDPRCAKDADIDKRRWFDARALDTAEKEDPSEPDLLPEPEETPTDEPEDVVPFEDCLPAWHRYCPSLRRVQIGGGTKGIAWRRRWDIDAWHKMWVEDVEDSEERVDSRYGLGDEGDDEDEGEIWSAYGNPA